MTTTTRHVSEVAEELGVKSEHVVPWGRGVAKIDLRALDGQERAPGELVIVSAITPARFGEGKTTVSVGLAMALRRLGTRAVVALREPSLGPVFGQKGGGTGGGRAQVEPADRINLHFTGDIHAVTSAHNLLAAMVDNELHFSGATELDPQRVTWPRVIDVEDRALRSIVVGLGGRAGGVTREARFDITAASEVMAVLCLATSRDDLVQRLARIVVGTRRDGSDVTAGDLEAHGAMAALLADALAPNLAQTSEGGPALVHGGPFGNIAHGCSSLLATRLGLAHGEVVVTEAGFGFELGGEKLLHIKCRQAGLTPRVVVLVVTCRALAAHGKGDLGDDGALARGLAHLDHQLANVRAFGLCPIVAINVFDDDDERDLALVEAHASRVGARVARFTAFRDGGEGGEPLARALLAELQPEARREEPRWLYRAESDVRTKVNAVAKTLYGARSVVWSDRAIRELADVERNGHGALPVCIAKTHLSLSDDPHGPALPGGFDVTVTGVRCSAGAGFLVILMGEVQTMPGLPRTPAARRVSIDADGRIRGLMQGD